MFEPVKRYHQAVKKRDEGTASSRSICFPVMVDMDGVAGPLITGITWREIVRKRGVCVHRKRGSVGT